MPSSIMTGKGTIKWADSGHDTANRYMCYLSTIYLNRMLMTNSMWSGWNHYVNYFSTKIKLNIVLFDNFNYTHICVLCFLMSTTSRQPPHVNTSRQPPHVNHLTSTTSCQPPHVSHLMSTTSCQPPHVNTSCQPPHNHLMSTTSCQPPHVNHLMSTTSCQPPHNHLMSTSQRHILDDC